MLPLYSSQGVVYLVDEATGGLEVSHRMVLSDRDYGGSPGPVGELSLHDLPSHASFCNFPTCITFYVHCQNNIMPENA